MFEKKMQEYAYADKKPGSSKKSAHLLKMGDSSSNLDLALSLLAYAYNLEIFNQRVVLLVVLHTHEL